MRFSDRIGVTEPNIVLGRDEMPESLRNMLWQVSYNSIKDKYYEFDSGSSLENLFERVWVLFFRKPSDEISISDHMKEIALKKLFYKLIWHEVYNYVEFVFNNIDKDTKKYYMKNSNYMLELEKSRFRFINGLIVELSSESEIEEINKSLSVSDKYASARSHIRQALALFNQKPEADYRNTIKESISAIESMAKLITEKSNTTLGAALSEIGKTKGMHSALKEGFSKLYGWTSDADGIRHAMMEESNIGEAEARYMLVTCSAFMNYLISLDVQKS